MTAMGAGRIVMRRTTELLAPSRGKPHATATSVPNGLGEMAGAARAKEEPFLRLRDERRLERLLFHLRGVHFYRQRDGRPFQVEITPSWCGYLSRTVLVSWGAVDGDPAQGKNDAAVPPCYARPIHHSGTGGSACVCR